MFGIVVCAYTCVGEETCALSAGLETQTEPVEVAPGFGAGVGAGAGNCATPLCGPALISTCTVGQDAGLGEGDGAGAGEGDEPGVVGGVTPPVEAVLDFPPQPINVSVNNNRKKTDNAAARRGAFKNTGNHLGMKCLVVRTQGGCAGCFRLGRFVSSWRIGHRERLD